MSTVKFLHKEVMYSSIDEIKASMILEPGDEFQIPLKKWAARDRSFREIHERRTQALCVQRLHCRARNERRAD